MHQEKKVLFSIKFSPTFSVMIFHFPFFNFPLSFFLKTIHYSQKNSSFARNYIIRPRYFRKNIFNVSFSSQKLTNRKNSITEKRDTISDKFSTQNLSSFYFQLSIFRRNFLLKIYDFWSFNRSSIQRIFFRSNWLITCCRLWQLRKFST